MEVAGLFYSGVNPAELSTRYLNSEQTHIGSHRGAGRLDKVLAGGSRLD